MFVELANDLAGRGRAVDIISTDNIGEVNPFHVNYNIGVYRVGFPGKGRLTRLLNIIKSFIFTRSHGKNCKIIISDPIMSVFLFILKGMDVSRFIQADDYRLFDDLYLFKNKVLLAVYKRLTGFSYKNDIKYLFNSRFSYSEFLGISKRKDVKFNLVHPGINPDVFYDKKLRRSSEINLCLAARRHPLKGFSDFIEVWRKDNDWLRERINKVFLVSDDNLAGFDLSGFDVVKPKNDKDIATVYNKSHIFISTSRSEGFGMPSLEAMACGCAVILSKAGGVNEYALDGENCLMYDPGNTAELSGKLRLLLGNVLLIKELSAKGMERAKEFTWDKSSEQFMKCIDNNV